MSMKLQSFIIITLQHVTIGKYIDIYPTNKYPTNIPRKIKHIV